MTDMNPFEQELSAGFKGLMGPSEPVDDAAIFADIATTQSPRWSFRSMFSATRFVVAGAIVALFGGFLLAGVVTGPSEELVPAADIESPTPTADLLSTLDTEDVGKGVRRFVAEGPVPWPLSTRDRLAIGNADEVYVIQEPRAVPDGSTTPARLARLDDAASWWAPDVLGSHNFFDLRVGPDGTIWFLGDHGWATFATGEWHVGDGGQHIADGPLHAVRMRPDGSAVALAQAPSQPGEAPAVNLVTISPTGEPQDSVALPPNLMPTRRLDREQGPIDVAATSTARWVGAHLIEEGGGLARLDDGASDWVAVEPLGGGVPFGTNALVASPDGTTLWALLVVEKEGERRRGNHADQPFDPVLARFAGGVWRTWGLDEGLPRVTGRWGHWYTLPMEVAPDGSVWMADYDNGITRFDGSTFTTYPDLSGSGSFIDVRDLAVASDGSLTALIADTPNGGDAASLYIIQPEALAPVAAMSSAPSPTEESTTTDDSVTITPDLLPGVDLVTEEVEPGVYRVVSDGVRDLSAQISQVTVSPEGDTWVELGAGEDWSIVRLGEPGVSLELGRQQRGTLGMTAEGAPAVVGRPAVTRLFDGGAWRRTELSEYDACWLEPLGGRQAPAVGSDGGCYTSRDADDERLPVRIDADGTRTTYSRAELGLGPEQNGVLHPVVGPDGSIWAAVFDTDFSTGIFEGLVRYDGSAWSFIPYDGDDAMLCGSCFTNLAVDQEGVVWFSRRVDDAPPVLSWDGESWSSYLRGEGRGLNPTPVQAWPNGDIWFGSDARWDGATLSLAEPEIPWGDATLPATAPDGSAWTVIDRHLYVITSEAAMEAE